MAGVSLDLIQYDKAEPWRDVSLVDPDTGEVVALSDATGPLIAAVLGRIQLALTETTEQLKEAKRLLGRELIARMDQGGEWTQRARGVKVSAPSPSAGTVKWDVELLDELLDRCVEDKLISHDAKLKAVSTRIEHVAHADGITRLLKIPAVAERMQAAKRVTEQGERPISIKFNLGEM